LILLKLNRYLFQNVRIEKKKKKKKKKNWNYWNIKSNNKEKIKVILLQKFKILRFNTNSCSTTDETQNIKNLSKQIKNIFTTT